MYVMAGFRRGGSACELLNLHEVDRLSEPHTKKANQSFLFRTV